MSDENESKRIRASIERLSRADPRDIHTIAGSQLDLLAGYHEIVLAQSRRIFCWALIGGGIGLLFLVLAVALALLTRDNNSLVPLLAGAIVEVVASVVFVLYGKTAAQLSIFHERLETLQRYLLANSICESLEGENRFKARVSLIQEISRTDAGHAQKA